MKEVKHVYRKIRWTETCTFASPRELQLLKRVSKLEKKVKNLWWNQVVIQIYLGAAAIYASIKWG